MDALKWFPDESLLFDFLFVFAPAPELRRLILYYHVQKQKKCKQSKTDQSPNEKTVRQL